MSKELVSSVRSGTIDSGAEATEKFPFDAFEFDAPSSAAPILRLRPPWKLAAASWVSGTAAALATLNAIVPVGQIAFETDTISIKVGDGATAYNSLTYVYRGLPVAGEPSIGTLHFHAGVDSIINGATWTVGTTYTIDCSAQVPAGAKAVLLKVYGTSVGNSYCYFYSDSGATILHDMFLNYGTHYNSDAITCGIDSALKCYGKVVTTDMTIYVRLVGYYM